MDIMRGCHRSGVPLPKQIAPELSALTIGDVILITGAFTAFAQGEVFPFGKRFIDCLGATAPLKLLAVLVCVVAVHT
jgi:hypothetical protein